MAKVYNWQLGREMDFPYEAQRPDRQFAMIFDMNKCIACQTCTVACKTTWTPGRGQEYMYWNNVETKPFGFYPLGWDVNVLAKLGVQPMDGPVYQGKTLYDAAPTGEVILGYLPDDLDYAHPNIGEDDCTSLMSQGAHLTRNGGRSWSAPCHALRDRRVRVDLSTRPDRVVRYADPAGQARPVSKDPRRTPSRG